MKMLYLKKQTEYFLQNNLLDKKIQSSACFNINDVKCGETKVIYERIDEISKKK